MALDASQGQDQKFHVTLSGDGMNIDRTVDSSTALAIVQLVLGNPTAIAGQAETARRKHPRKKNSDTESGSSGKARKRRSSSPGIVRDLSLHPKDRPPFADFVAEKKPRNHPEKQVVSVYWLSKVAGVENVSADHVNTCYVGMQWKRPADFDNSLQVTSGRKGWIDTSDGSNIVVTVPGEDYVDHDLPGSVK
jgi:hypothetical protein